MKLWILITVYNRQDYTRRCFQSIVNAQLPPFTSICIVDDCSDDLETLQYIDAFDKPGYQVIKHRHGRNLGVKKSLSTGIKIIQTFGLERIMILDNDAIVKRDGVHKILALSERFPDAIVSGFNTLSIEESTGQPRHPIIEQFDGYAKKKSIGGINMMFTLPVYLKYIRSALLNSGHWDWRVAKSGVDFYVTTPSVIQHIGIKQGMNLNNPDVAHDY